MGEKEEKKEGGQVMSEQLIVDGRPVTQQEFQEMISNPNIRLVLVDGSTSQYKTLQKLYG